MKEIIKGRYQLIRIIGEGGYGKVWLALDTLEGTEVALKVYKETPSSYVLEEARREYELGKELKHPNIHPVLDMVEDGESVCLVMPYCPHSTLWKMRGKYNEKTIWEIAKDIASGLKYLHNLGIVHRDVQLANILLNAEGKCVLADLGVSYKISDRRHLKYENEKTIIQSVYQPPECRADQGTHSDVWSFGIALYELAYGKLPKESSEYGIEIDEAAPLCGESARLKNLIRACTMPYYQLRPSAEDILNFIDEEMMADRGWNRNAEMLFVPEYATINEIPEYATINEKMLNYANSNLKVVRDAVSFKCGIMDVSGNLLVDYEYDRIAAPGVCSWIVTGGPCGAVFFVGARFWQGDETGCFKVDDDGSLSECYRCSNEEYEKRETWT